MFTYNIEPIISNVVATIGGKDVITKRVFIVRWYWNDDEGQKHKNK